MKRLITLIIYIAFITVLCAGNLTAQETYTITLLANPPQGGTVDGGGTHLPEGMLMPVMAIPSSLYTFINWTENGEEVSVEPNYEFIVTRDRNLVANFVPVDYYYITVSAVPVEGGIVTGGGIYQYGMEVLVTATPNPYFEFLYWTENGKLMSFDSEYIFDVTGDHHVIANFAPANYYITLLANPIMGGTVIGEGVYQYGMEVLVTATPNSNFEFLYWTNENGELTCIEPEYLFMVSGNHILIAHFGQSIPFEITVSANPPEGGTVSGGGSFTVGTPITVAAEAHPDFLFVNWTENNTIISTDAHYSFPVYGPRNLVANFVPSNIEITLSKNIEEGGTVSGGGTYSYGQTVIVGASQNLPEYMFDNWTEDGNVVSLNFAYAFTAIQSRHLVANFTPAIYDIPVYADPYEGGTVTGGGTYTYGSHVTISAVANPDYQFLNWTKYTLGNGTVVSTEPDYTYEITGDGWGNTAFVAYFEGEGKVITILTNIPGGEVLGGGTYKYGDEVTIEAIPNPGYKFVNWMAEGKSVISTDNPYSFIVTESMLLIANFEDDGMVDIKSINADGISIYPNPTTGELRVTSYGLRVTGIEIYDISGKKFNSKFNIQNSEFVTDISDFPAGVYFIQLQTEQGTVTKRFVKN